MDITLLGKVPSKKNSKQLVPVRGRMIIVSGKFYKAWHKDQWPVVKLWMRNEGKQFPLESVRQVHIEIFAGDRRAGDLTNKAESIMDLLVECGVLQDDNWFVVGNINLVFGGVDKINPRATISFL